MNFRSDIKKRMKRLGLTKPKLSNYTRVLPFDGNAEVHIAIVGSESRGLAGHGKTRPDRYFPRFEYGAIKAGATVAFYQTPSLLVRSLHLHDGRPLAVILLYNEERIEDYPAEATMRILEKRPCTIVYDSPAIARKIAEKPITNRILLDAGIDVPSMSSRADRPLFSNANTGSMQPTSVIAQGGSVDAGRYNTELIDTRVKVEGREYFVSLRAMCLSGVVLDVYVRCRPVDDGTPNVHSRDTPIDPRLLNFIYHEHVQPRMDEILSICERLGSVLGPALYAHDILLSRDGRLPVCEVGFKFDDSTLIDHLWPLASGLEFMRSAFLYEQAEDSAELVTESIRKDAHMGARTIKATSPM